MIKNPPASSIYIFLLLLVLSSCRTNTFLSNIDTDRLTLSDSSAVEEDKEILEMIAPYKESLDAQMNQVIGVITTDLHKSKPEGTLGNWMTDILLDRANAHVEKPVDFALQNYGGIRIPILGKGEITVRHIFELMPFENALVVMDIDGEIMWEFIERIAASGGWPVSKGLTMVITPGNKPVDVKVNGMPFEMSRKYRVVLPDYVANGGDRCDFLIPLPRTEIGLKVRDAIIEYLEQHNEPMNAVIEQRITRIEN